MIRQMKGNNTFRNNNYILFEIQNGMLGVKTFIKYYKHYVYNILNKCT